MSQVTFPLDPLEIRIRNHALVCAVGFLVLLPIGVLVARYSRTFSFTKRWFWVHSIFQLPIAGSVIIAGWSLGYKITASLETGHFKDPHQKIGLALLILYLLQSLVIGPFAHFLKFEEFFGGHRGPQSYLHAVVGLAIIGLANYQVYYGLNTEWYLVTGGVHQISQMAKHAWLALIILFAALYALGLGLLPRQFKQEKRRRSPK